MNAQGAGAPRRVGLNVSPITPLVATLTAGQMQMVEIAKALSLDARIIIMDEPTSSLDRRRVRSSCSRSSGSSKSDGIGIIYISHRMEEVLDLADRITVLRDGRYVGRPHARRGHRTRRSSRMMVGRELSSQYFPPKRRATAVAEAVLEVEGPRSCPGAPAGVSFTARARRDLGLRRPGRLRAHRADGGHLRRDPALGGHHDARRASPSRPRSTARRHPRAASTSRRKIASATAWCCR